MAWLAPSRFRRCKRMHGGADARIGSAAANVGDRLRKLVVCWSRIFGKQRAYRHDHSRLAVAALRNLMFDPRLLDRGQSMRAQTLNRGDFGIADGADRNHATALRFAVDVNRARTALGDAAAELRSG